jgi:hypothetical protein
LNSPKRFAVAALLTAAGWAIQHFGGVPYALLVGLFAGIFAARLVPGRGCAVNLSSKTLSEN